MVGIAVVFGLLAVFVAQGWLAYQAELSRKTTEPTAKPVATRNIVIASGPLRFGTRLSADALREVAWSDEAIPAGTFSSIADLMSAGNRIVLASIEKNEPILRTKVTGPGQKATLSAVIQDGMRAEESNANSLFERIRHNWWHFMKYTKRYSFVVNVYGQVADIFPLVVASPRFFTGAISFGTLMQIGRAHV